MEKQYYKEYYELERSHWWFKARLEILERLLQEKILRNGARPLRILNAGVATGATTTMLQKHGEVISLEYDKDCCEFLKTVVNMEVVNASLTDLPFEDRSFDLVCAFDVIEHIEDDNLAVREIRRVLKDDGTMFLTVPAFMFLWSHHDDINHHYRRYTMKTLRKVLLEESFRINFGSYFNAVLFLPISAIRLLLKLLPKRKESGGTGSDFELFKSKTINDFFYWIFRNEAWPLRKGITFPFGISLVAIANKS
ncbi:MAG TPA: methyltransferase domain-containing protein [Ohtaekwangia sp.]|uniref:class I SAM-dependent methyltransferase n=1 Tax=Ohtaekwangia sp. TaxID=2066019 RepID=UPI002F921113